MAVLAGADVYVAEVNGSVCDIAKAVGAKGVGNSSRELGDDFDVIVDYAGFGTTTAEAIESVRFGGRVVQVGWADLR